MSQICLFAVFCIAWLVTLSQCQQITGGPDNVIAFSSHEAALFCNRSASNDVEWKFRAPGSDQERDIPGRYRSMKTNYGVHSLVLENLQLSNAGTYVCRSVGAHELKPAGAFVVVIAQKPFCRVDNVNSAKPDDRIRSDQSILTCSVTYAGQMDASVSLLVEGNDTFLSENFIAQQVASSHAVKTYVPASTVQQAQYSCRVSFFSSHSHVDVAKNQPGFVEVMCYVPFTRIDGNGHNIQTTDVSSSSSLQDAASCNTGNSITVIFLTVIFIILFVIVVVMTLCFTRGRLLACPCFQSAVRRHPVMFRHCCVDIAARHMNHCEADDGDQFHHVQVSQDIEAAEVPSSTEDMQLFNADVPQDNH